MKTTPLKFRKGDRVIIKNPLKNCPNAQEAAERMGATNWIRGLHDERYDCGDRATVLDGRRNRFKENVYLIEVNEEQHVVGESGLEHLLKGILKYGE